MKHLPEDVIVFLGPSLPEDQAQQVLPCLVLPPARQGDIWRALALRPRIIVLVDGIFEAQPSVWHHELLAALEAGVAVLGGASMGALRAAELAAHGMVGVGRIFEAYRDGELVDDSEVALLHAGPEHDYRPLTVPLVNVRHVARQALSARVLDAKQSRVLVAAAQSLFYQDRTWKRILEAVRPRWPAPTRADWEGWFSRGVEDLKRLDALACLRAAAAFRPSSKSSSKSKSKPKPSSKSLPGGGLRPPPSSLVRRRRLVDGVSIVESKVVSSAQVLEVLQREPDSVELAEAGLRRALLAGWARSLGLVAAPEEVRAAEAEWWRRLQVHPSRRELFLATCGMDEPALARLCEEHALERLMLAHAQRLLPDGTSWDEALASEARIQGRWAVAAKQVSRARRQRPR